MITFSLVLSFMLLLETFISTIRGLDVSDSNMMFVLLYFFANCIAYDLIKVRMLYTNFNEKVVREILGENKNEKGK